MSIEIIFGKTFFIDSIDYDRLDNNRISLAGQKQIYSSTSSMIFQMKYAATRA